MWLTNKLAGLLNRVFDRTPAQSLGLCLDYTAASGMTWSVSDGVLTTTVPGNLAACLSIDLSQYTLATLAFYLAAQPGYVVTALNNALSSLSALVLIDSSGNPALSNGDHLYAFSSPNWAYLDTVASELHPAKQAIEAMPAEMATTTADGEWLDLQGAYYAVPRLAGEADTQYAPRIPATVLQPKCNNIAIELAIEAAVGQAATVTDVVEYGAAIPLYNGLITHNGSHQYNASAEPIYGLFDVATDFDLLGSTSPATFLALVQVIVGALRAAGTQLRALILQGSSLSDTLTPPSDAISILSLVPSLGDSLTGPTDSTSLMGVRLGAISDSLTAPSDLTDDLQVIYTTTHNGLRRYDGSRIYASGYLVDETMSGTINSISTQLLVDDSGGVLLTTDGGALLTP